MFSKAPCFRVVKIGDDVVKNYGFNSTPEQNFRPVPVNPFPNKPWFLRVCRTSLLKTQWEKEKFLLFLQCFLPVWRTFCHPHQIWICWLQTLSVWKHLKFIVWERVKKHAQRTNYTDWNQGKYSVIKYCGSKGEMLIYQHFLLFPHCFHQWATMSLPQWATEIQYHVTNGPNLSFPWHHQFPALMAHSYPVILLDI